MDINQIKKYRKLGLNIAYYRKEKGYTQLQLSELLNIDRTHMGNIELARSGVSLDILFQMSDLLEIPVHKFFEFRD
ncbi:MAG: helix-turn-helix domain-containing protein [Oscillospiraceae bacterium]|nr:helix-turn-helix domain-containing protein [Oscillospiraceae bacterium]